MFETWQSMLVQNWSINIQKERPHQNCQQFSHVESGTAHGVLYMLSLSAVSLCELASTTWSEQKFGCLECLIVWGSHSWCLCSSMDDDHAQMMECTIMWLDPRPPWHHKVLRPTVQTSATTCHAHCIRYTCHKQQDLSFFNFTLVNLHVCHGERRKNV
jgi:hypothetical protein